ncbi:MAG: CopG family transcriptional regulator [Candidatus Dormibacteria bacterium]
MSTRNVTVTLPSALLKKVKIVAARRDTSISALLLSSLEEIVDRDDDAGGARRRLMARANQGFDLGTGGRPVAARDALHER